MRPLPETATKVYAQPHEVSVGLADIYYRDLPTALRDRYVRKRVDSHYACTIHDGSKIL